MTLYDLTGEYLRLYEMVGDMEDDEAFEDTLEMLDEELEDKADGYAKVIRQMVADEKAIKEEIDRLKARRDTLNHHIDRMKENLKEAMKFAGKDKIKTEFFSFSIRKNQPSVVIDDMDTVPEEYFRVKKEPDKTAIKAFLSGLDSDNVCAFAHLESGDSLTIR